MTKMTKNRTHVELRNAFNYIGYTALPNSFLSNRNESSKFEYFWIVYLHTNTFLSGLITNTILILTLLYKTHVTVIDCSKKQTFRVRKKIESSLKCDLPAFWSADTTTITKVTVINYCETKIVLHTKTNKS